MSVKVIPISQRYRENYTKIFRDHMDNFRRECEMTYHPYVQQLIDRIVRDGKNGGKKTGKH
jgi:hypothetical protein